MSEIKRERESNNQNSAIYNYLLVISQLTAIFTLISLKNKNYQSIISYIEKISETIKKQNFKTFSKYNARRNATVVKYFLNLFLIKVIINEN